MHASKSVVDTNILSGRINEVINIADLLKELAGCRSHHAATVKIEQVKELDR